MKRRILGFTLMLLALSGCAPSGAPTAPPESASAPSVSARSSAVAQAHGLHITGGAVVIDTALPGRLDDANWGPKAAVSRDAGFDLAPLAGRSVVLARYAVSERYGREPLYLWLVENGDRVVGAYLSVRERSTLTPGVFSLDDTGIGR